MLNLRHGIYLIIFLMPLYFWRFSVFGMPMNILELMIYILLLIWIFNKARKGNFCLVLAKKLKSLYKNDFILLVGIIFLFLGVIISTTLSADLRASLGIFKGWFVSPFLFAFVFVNVIKKREHIILSLKSWLVSGTVVSLVGAYYLLNNDITFDGRLRAFFLSPNHLAMYLAPAFLIIFSFSLNRKKNSNLLSLAVFAVVLSSFYFTYSYGAFLGIFAGILYLVIKSKGLKIRNVYLLGFVVLLTLGMMLASSGKFGQIMNSENRSSFHSRVMIWNATEEIIKDNLFLGIGPGTFQETYLGYSEKFDEPYLEWAVPQPHNIFLAFYLQTGLIGFVGFLLILIWFFLDKDIKSTYPRSELEIVYIINAIMIYIIVHGFVDTTYWKNDLALMFWILVGIKFICRKRFNSRVKEL